MSDVTGILQSIESGDPAAANQLLPLVYDELRRLAAARMARENPGQTLQATALVHEAYLRLVDADAVPGWNSRGHFFGAAAEAMRRILVENARRRDSGQRGGGRRRFELRETDRVELPPRDDLLDLNDALDRLERADPRIARVVKLRVFGGLTFDEIARCTGVSTRTAKRDWTYARAWLGREIESAE